MTDQTQNDSPQRYGAGEYQMLWDCRFCGTEKLLGVTHRHCPNCGAAQDPEWRYFPAEEDVVTLADHAFVGADKMCPACRQPNSAASQFCSECGADLSAAEAVAAVGKRQVTGGHAESDTRRDVVKEQFEAEMERIAAEERAQPVFLGLTRRHLTILGVLAAVALIIGGAIWFFTRTEQIEGEVTELTWARIVEVEDYQPREREAWWDEVSDDGYDRRCEERTRRTEQVEVDTEEVCEDVDRGDGSFERVCRDEPVYDEVDIQEDWCTYTIDAWEHNADLDVVASGEGTDDPAPYWPEYEPPAVDGDGEYGQQRERGQREAYTVVLRVDGEKQSCTFDDQDTWAQYDVGMAVAIEQRTVGDVDCDTLKPAE